MINIKNKPILVQGNDVLACSVVVCMLNAGHPVVMHTEMTDAGKVVDSYMRDQEQFGWKSAVHAGLRITDSLDDLSDCEFAILITAEDRMLKWSAIQKLQAHLAKDAIVAVNSESIPLSDLQAEASSPERLITMNWCDPAHTTYFLEIISNDTSDKKIGDEVAAFAKTFWKKDPYVLKCDVSIRSRMTAAMVREAFYLLENGYVSIEDIDRACRNDAGYYLSFAGHCRYMDLMGTYIYGKVMEDLNPELSKEATMPEFFNALVRGGAEGMKNGKGFYTYSQEEIEDRVTEYRRFSYEISDLIWRYPFRYKSEGRSVTSVSASI